MATAELAMVFPVILVLLAVALGAARYGIDQIRCVDAARASARAAARGDDPAAVRALALRGAPEGTRVEASFAGGQARVRVAAPAAGWWPWNALPPPVAEAVADLEDAGAT